MKKRNIFQNQSQAILSLFETADNRSSVMCVPIDYAKRDHTVMFCNGNGKILRKPFSVKNSLVGKDYLVEQIERSRHYHGIQLNHIFMGGENIGSYAENFVEALRSDDWLVAGVNAYDAKVQRENLQASTDCLDLMGIAKLLITCRGNCFPAQSGVYRNLRMLVRHRRKLVEITTEVKNRIHTIVDRLFPGFLNEHKSGISPFSNGSLWLMKDRFSPQQIRRKKRSTLITALRKQGTNKSDKAADKLQHYAVKVINPQKDFVCTLQNVLTQHIRHLICLLESIEQLENEIARTLAHTQGAFLTSIRGIGIVLAAGVCAEIGDPNKQKPLSSLVSYSGIIPKVKQTGGKEGQTRSGKVAKRCNRILKDYVVQSAAHMGKHGPDDLMMDHKRRSSSGQHADFGIARRYLRMTMSLMKNSQTYLPGYLRSAGCKKEERAEYYLMTWHNMREKWRKANALKVAFSKEMPLGTWRNMIQELYGIKLGL
ncbi:MAG: IS110 family transposase [Desulfobacteraceae bacterium]|nr:IS110 family transposase [Desulfobacteraceae bacterium]